MDGKDQEKWLRANGNDTLLNGVLVAALASLLLHAVSAGTVQVPMPNAPQAVVNDTPIEYPFG